MFVILKNPQTGNAVRAKVGFSYTTFFFGIFPAIFRRDWINLLIMLAVNIVTCGVSHIVWAFIYNRMYIKSLIKEGYAPMNAGDREILMQKGIEVPELVA